MEGTLADKYGLTLRDIITMSWRRFCVLYNYLFTSGALTRVDGKDTDTSQEPSGYDLLKGGRSYDDIDWNKLTNTPPADHKRQVSFSEFMDGSGLTRKVVD